MSDYKSDALLAVLCISETTVKILKTQTSEKFAVITLKGKQGGFTFSNVS